MGFPKAPQTAKGHTPTTSAKAPASLRSAINKKSQRSTPPTGTKK